LFGRAAYDILPTIAPGLIGLLLASLLAAIMSTSDAQMVVSSGLFTENIYKKYLAKNKSQRHYLWVGRLSGLFIVLLAIVLQTTFEDVIQALQYILDTPAIIGISLWIGIVWRGWTPAAVWVSTICGGLAWAACMFFPNQLREWGLSETMFHSNGKMLHLWRIVFYLSTGLVSGILASLVTKRVREDKLDQFFRLIHTPVKPDEQIDAPCTLPKDPLPPAEKLFNFKDIEISKPTLVGMVGFFASWICVGLIVWLTSVLARLL
jgi:Na+/proline symporter